MTIASDIAASFERLLRQLGSDKSRRAYRLDWERYLDWLATQKIDVLKAKPRHVEDHIVSLQEDGCERSTCGRALSVIRAAYGRLVLDELIEVNPAREVKNPKFDSSPKTPWMTKEQMKALYKAMPENSWRERRDKLVIRAMMSLGWRRAEIACIRADDIEGGSIHVIVKGGKHSALGMPPRLLTDISEWRRYAGIENGPLFPLSQDELDQPITHDIVYHIVKAAAGRVGLNHITPHSFRRSMLTYLHGAGVDGSILQGAVSHQSYSTTERYLKASDAATRAPGELVLEMLDEETEK